MPNKQLRLALADKDLTPIEKRVIESLCIGKTLKEIMYEVNLEINKEIRRTFYYHYEKIKIKLGAKTNEHAVAIYTLKHPELVRQLLERVR